MRGENKAMAKQTKKRDEFPSNEQIQEKLSDLDTLAEKAIAGEYGNKKTTVMDKLDLVRNTLLKFKDEEGKPKATYATISKVLEDGIGLKVSEQTLRKYCHDHLGFVKFKRKNTDAEKNIDTNADKESNKINDSKDDTNATRSSARDSLSSKTELK